MITTIITDEVFEAIGRLVQYLYDEEADHFEECEPDEKQGHIFIEVRTVSRWVDHMKRLQKRGFRLDYY